MQRVFSWFGKAARYVANTRVGKLAVATHLSFLNEYLKRPISPEQFAHGDSINLSDLHFKAEALNVHLAPSPVLVSSLWISQVSFCYEPLGVSLNGVVLVLKWNPSFQAPGAATTGETQLYEESLTEMKDVEFDFASYLEGSPNDLMRRFVNILLHRISVNISTLVVALETPHGDGKVDILRFATDQISLSKSEKLSQATAANLSFSDMSKDSIKKLLEIIGPTTLELFQVDHTVITSTFHVPRDRHTSTHPKLLEMFDPIRITSSTRLHPSLVLSFQAELPSIFIGAHASQLPIASNILRYYNLTMQSSSAAPKPCTDSSRTSNDINPSASTSMATKLDTPALQQQSISVNRFKYQATDGSDDSDESEDASNNLSFAQSSQDVVSVSLANLDVETQADSVSIHTSLVVPSIVVAYVPFDGKLQSPPFINTKTLREPSLIATHFILSRVSNLQISTSPNSQVASLDATVSEYYWVDSTERVHLPLACLGMLPTDGYYIHDVLSVTPKNGTHGLTISNTNSGPSTLRVQLGLVSACLPLGLPKLCSVAISELNASFPSSEAPPTEPAKHYKSLAASKEEAASQAAEAHAPSMDNDPQRLFLESLRLGEELVFEPGAYNQTEFSIAGLEVNLEVPLQHQPRFDLPVRRCERLKLEIDQITAQFSSSSSPAPEMPYQTVSASFSTLNVYVESDYFRHEDRKLQRVIKIEANSANSEEFYSETLRMEWRTSPSLTSLTEDQIRHAPYSVPNSEIGVSKRALSHQEFQDLASAPSQLSIVLTVHMSEVHLSPLRYSFVMDVYDRYCQLTAPESPVVYQKKELSPLLVDFRSNFGCLLLQPQDEDLSVIKALESHQDTLIYDVQLEDIRALQIGSFYGTNKSFLAVEIENIDLHHNTRLVQGIHLESSNAQRRFSYASCSEVLTDEKGVSTSDLTVLVELRHLIISWCSTDTWPQEIASVFYRIEWPEYFPPFGVQEQDPSAQLPYKSRLLLNASGTSFAIWGPYSPSSLNLSDSQPRLLATPQLVLVPQRLHLSIEFDDWMYHMKLDRAELFTTLDRNQTPEEPLFSPFPTITKTVRGYWYKREHSYAGLIATSTVTFVPSMPGNPSQVSLKIGLDLSTTPSQVAALQLLFSTFSNITPNSEQLKASKSKKDGSSPIHPGAVADEYEEVLRPSKKRWMTQRNIRSPPEEPQVRVEAHLDELGKFSINDFITENYVPQPHRESAPLKLVLSLSPTDLIWRLRPEGTIKGTEARASPHIQVVLTHAQVRYEVDENGSTLLEATVKRVDGFSFLKSSSGSHFFGFDQNASHFRPNLLSFHLTSCLPCHEASAPRSISNNLSSSVGLCDYLDEFSSERQASVASDRLDTRLKLMLLPLQLTLNLDTFSFIHKFHRSYTTILKEYDPPVVSGTGTSFVDSLLNAIGSIFYASPPSDSIPSPDLSESSPSFYSPSSAKRSLPGSRDEDLLMRPAPPGTFFKSLYVSDIRLKLNLPGVDGAKIRLPSVISVNIDGWEGVSTELAGAYTPFLNEALTTVISAFPGVKLLKTAGMGLVKLVTIPMEERKSNRSMTWAVVSQAGHVAVDVSSELVALSSVAFQAVSKSLGSFGSWMSSYSRKDEGSASSSSSPSSSSSASPPSSSSSYPSGFREGISQASTSVSDSVLAAGEAISGPIRRYKEDGSALLLLKDTLVAVPSLVVLPTAGIVQGAADVLSGTAARMKQDHTTRANDAHLKLGVPFIPVADGEEDNED